MSGERKPMLRVTCEDLETGEQQVQEVPAGEYVLITTDPAYVAHTQTYKGGQTVQVTIKDRLP